MAKSAPTHKWDAETYDRVSDPQARWGKAVLERLELRGAERVLDAGCGTGRVSEQLAERLPRGTLVALDADEAMLAQARERLARFEPRVEYVHANLQDPLPVEAVDAIFSTATFHWVRDHDRLFRNLGSVLKSGGQLVAQFGGQGNTRSFLEVLEDLGVREHAPWNFPGPEETRQRLEVAGFEQVQAWLHDEPTPFESLEDMDRFIRTSCLGPWLARLPAEERGPFSMAVASRMPKLEVDYVRLNLIARRR